MTECQTGPFGQVWLSAPIKTVAQNTLGAGGMSVRLRDEIHHRNLLNQDADVSDDKFVVERQLVTEVWQQWLNLD